jgi:thiamine pyrophosphokinase
LITIIFANGNLDPSPEIDALLKKADLIIAADGGANHCAQLGINPDILLGDLDSIHPKILESYKSEGIVINRHPKRKDATDLELALDLAVEKGSRSVWLVGALGGRWDMSLANIMLAAGDKYKHLKTSMLGRDCSMQILHPATHTIIGKPGQKVSILPLKGDAHGVTLTGFEYPLRDHTIPFGSSIGVSNIMEKDQGTVQFTQGILLCVLFQER